MQEQIDTCPTFVEVHSFLARSCDTMYSQLVNFANTSPDRARECARQAALEFEIKLCVHGEDVPRPLEGTTLHLRAVSIVADGGHEGLCGRH